MKLTRLRLVGFKSFVEPTEFVIEPGLTGVVGPNGCGKSNLVEALRWVMGESSHKNMRASGMDDVIFSGSGEPARRATPPKCTLAIDNADRTAPAAFNDADAARGLAPHRARGGLDLPHQRPRGARPRRAAAVRRRRDRRALAGARAPGPDRRDHRRQAAGAPPHPRGGRRHRRAARPPPRGGAAAQGRRGQPRCASTTCCASSTRRSTASSGRPARPRATRTSRPRSAGSRRCCFAIGYAEAREQAASAERAGRPGPQRASPTRRPRRPNAATAQAVAAHALPALREAEAAAARGAAAPDRMPGTSSRRRSAAPASASRSSSARSPSSSATSPARTRPRPTAPRRSRGSRARARSSRRNGAGAEAAKAEAEARLRRRRGGARRGRGRARRAAGAGPDLNARKSALDRSLREENERAARFAAERARVERDLAAIEAAGGERAAPRILRAALAAAEETLRSADERSAEARDALADAREAEARGRGPADEPSAPRSASRPRRARCQALRLGHRRHVAEGARLHRRREGLRDRARRGARRRSRGASTDVGARCIGR